ncbi:hypothetical protein [Microlunatus flavus]|uniref:Uncharacterized protein n=1 Tax=Microlunatus flavus TaxID=1036181 RepID=A0A1H9CQX3_9ACTN|nr:hypothetical protein [Microlunatus flavus]SEQ03554.1 hypothetical protein SAMN05421756_102295 [Microlunatus flavus]
MTAIDPWDTGSPPDPQPLTREDRISSAVVAVHERGPRVGLEHVAWDQLPAHVRHDYTEDIATALDAAYPLIESDEEIEALPQGAIIVNEHGRVEQPVLDGGLGMVGQIDVGTRGGSSLESARPAGRRAGARPRRSR